MKLRIAKKICKSMAGESKNKSHYSLDQKEQAVNRTERTKSSREANEYWHALMRSLGPEGRADVVKSWSPGDAFKLLMRELP